MYVAFDNKENNPFFCVLVAKRRKASVHQILYALSNWYFVLRIGNMHINVNLFSREQASDLHMCPACPG